ncbi:MAG: pantoate--beta-alanine ligase [Methylococcaceae bacterium]|nr:MAG: pantoate--beta-alanine ligase [Methylococcaceae bacterium]
MQTLHTVSSVREHLHHWRKQGQSIGFVPTMGNLHAGHIHLVEQARRLANRVIVSIFVNPTQFGINEDYGSYPRTPEQDAAHLAAAGTDLLFLPGVAEMFPRLDRPAAYVEVPALSEDLCGHYRPGHFRGVATVVCKLFNVVQPDLALFGEKDYQQLTVIRRMVADLNLPVSIHGVPTVRDADGLALSSRNGYLSPDERALAPRLYQALTEAAARIRAGATDFAGLEQQQLAHLRQAGFEPDYFSIRRAEDLAPPDCHESRGDLIHPLPLGEGRGEGNDHGAHAAPDNERRVRHDRLGDTELVILTAARLGRTRLIDNLRCPA